MATDELRLFDVDAARLCAWCGSPFGLEAGRRDAIYCGKSCRQAAHRFRAGYTERPAPERELELAYADPPYPGLARRYYEGHRDYAGEVDHDELIERLVTGYPDGWALSTNSRSLAWLLRRPGMPSDVEVASWTRGARPNRSALPLQTWEPVIYRAGRQEPPQGDDPTQRLDALVYTSRVRATDPNRVTGAKPAAFAWWLFDLLGALPGDRLDDLYPGSHGIARAWAIYCNGRPLPSLSPATGRHRTTDPSPGPRDLLLEV